MQKAGIVLALAVLAAAARPASADTRNGLFVSTSDPHDGSFGFHIFGTDLVPRGISWDGDSTSTPLWGLNLVHGGSSDGDLYLQAYGAGVNMLEMRQDGGETWLGQGVGHPGTGAQLAITAGGNLTPRDGVASGVYGDQSGLALSQLNGTTLRTKIRFANSFQIGTDSAQANAADFFLQDVTTQGAGHYPLTISAATSATPDLVTLGYGLTVNGGSTLNGPTSLLGSATLGGTTAALGFYGAAGMAKQTVVGCRSDGTALASMLTALKNLGLINDQTTP